MLAGVKLGGSCPGLQFQFAVLGMKARAGRLLSKCWSCPQPPFTFYFEKILTNSPWTFTSLPPCCGYRCYRCSAVHTTSCRFIYFVCLWWNWKAVGTYACHSVPVVALSFHTTWVLSINSGHEARQDGYTHGTTTPDLLVYLLHNKLRYFWKHSQWQSN